jgi:RNA polymerase sigma-70 factor (ECF subfamily)
MIRAVDDLLWIRRCLSGDQEAFGVLLDRYKNQIFTLILRIVPNSSDAEDLAQDAFLKAFRKLEFYDPAYPFITWLFKIAHNTALDFLKARSPALISIEDDESALQIEGAEISVEEKIVSALRAEQVEKALASLPPLYREILILRHHEGLDYDSMAQVLQIPEGTVKIRLFRARNLMQEKLSGIEA